MNPVFSQLKPSAVWKYFSDILELPRPSKKEEKIISYLLEFAKKNHLDASTDSIGNVVIRKPSFPGMENKPVVVMQTHIDMVCEKNSDVQHDFEKDPIIPRIDGEWVKATGTTLGADCGLAVAAKLAILADKSIAHGSLEALFTVDEETGLGGAFNLQPGFINGKILLNLDSEDEGELFIGCAGGIDTVATFCIKYIATPDGYTARKIMVSGLTGGHSGDDIHKGFGNANKILNRFLWEMSREMDIHIADIDGGNLRNAIPREAWAVVCLPSDKSAVFEKAVAAYKKEVRNEYAITEKELSFKIQTAVLPAKVFSNDFQLQLMNALYACPHGVIAYSASIPGFVETSTNLASVKVNGEKLLVTTSQRSSVESEKTDIANMVEACFLLAGAVVEHGDGYPGWSPNTDSAILELTRKSFVEVYGYEPLVKAIHAGLECGIIGEKYPGMDMISFGPTIKGAHSPDERLKIDTVEPFYRHVLDVLYKV